MKITRSLSLSLRQYVLPALALALFAGATSSANAQVIFDDAVDGNASSNGASPTLVDFSIGSNIINGTVSSPTNTRNFYTFTIDTGQELTAINLDSINVVDAAGAPSQDPGFYAIVAGSTSATPGADFTNLGGALFSPSLSDSDLLAPISTAGGDDIASGTGFSSIGAGDYTFVIQQTGDEVSSFSLDFQVSAAAVPEPTSAIVLVGLGVASMARRRRR